MKAYHDLGVGFVATGGYLIADAGQMISSLFGGSLGQMAGNAMRGNYSVGNLIKIAVIGMSGVLLIFAFLGFTFSFGLRYIDALLRAYIAMGLAPIFIILWAFDRTRPMAIAAFKAIMFMCAVFMVSGISYAFAILIMQKGLTSAGLGSDMSAQGVMKAGAAILGSGGNTGAGGGGGLADYIGMKLGGDAKAQEIRWDIYFILLATGSLAMGMTTLSFKIAEKFMAFAQSGERLGMVAAAQGAGRTIDESFEGAKDQIGRTARRAGRGVFGGGR